MNDTVRTLLNLLTLDTLTPNTFRGNSQNLGGRSVFGGQVVAQALTAATHTVDDDRQAHSLHGYFLAPGDQHAPIDFHVEALRDGRSFSVRRVTAQQTQGTIFTATLSFQVSETSVEHQMPMPDVTPPDDLLSEHQWRLKLAEHVPTQKRALWTQERAIEIRPIDPINPFAPEARKPHKCAWFRTATPINEPAAMHQALITYASDFGLLGAAMQPHRLSFLDPQLKTASLDHAIWFHRPCRADDWLLYVMSSPNLSHACGYNQGHIFSQDGRLVASVTQEGLIRQRTV